MTREMIDLLVYWYKENKRNLPWRGTRDSYAVWVSEIMLQQTRVQAVIPYYRNFMDVLPDVHALAAVPEEKLMKLWQGLGYYNRARLMKKTAWMVMERFHGTFPTQYPELLKLPGVGEYTAGAIASIACGEAVPAVDGNVCRVMARLYDDHRPADTASFKSEYKEKLQTLIPKKCPGDFNQALMELGALICLSSGMPLCDRCPVCSFCLGNRYNTAEALPVKQEKKIRKIENHMVYLMFYQHRVAIRKRPEQGLLAGLWEYPQELVEDGDIWKRWSLNPLSVRPYAGGVHRFTHVQWNMTALIAEMADEALPEGWAWVGAEQLSQKYPMPSAFRCFEPEVQRYLNGKK